MAMAAAVLPDRAESPSAVWRPSDPAGHFSTRLHALGVHDWPTNRHVRDD